MATKKEQLTRMSQKHDIEAHWKLAENFIPIAGEIIVYDPDEVYDYARFKCGDGVTKVNDLPFIFKIDENYATKEYVGEEIANITIEVDSTLTKEGEAADAKAVGDALINLYTGADIYIVTPDGIFTLAELLHLQFQMNLTYNIQVVSELPNTLEPSILEDGGAINLYVVRNTGIAYGDIGDGVSTLGYGLFRQDGFDKGWSSNVNNETTMGVYCVGKIKNIFSWNDLTDKPFGEVEENIGNTVTWDGNLETFKGVKTEPFTNVDEMGDTYTIQFVKVSDSVPALDDIGSNSTIKYMQGDDEHTSEASALENDGIIGVLGSHVSAFIIPIDNCEYQAIVFPEKGVYFMHIAYDHSANYCASFTIPNYNFVNTTLKKIDEKYLPDDIGRESIVDVTELPTTNIDQNIIHRLPRVGKAPELFYINANGELTPYLGIFNAVMGFASDDGSGTQYIPFASAKYILVDELPEEVEQIILKGGIVPIYIVKTTGVGYVRLSSNSWHSAGQAVFGKADRGWSENISEETIEGIYTANTEFEPSTYNVFDGNQWATFLSETDKTLSKEGKAADAKTVGEIANALYTGAEIWMCESNEEVFNLGEYIERFGGKVNIELVDELPTTLEPSSESTLTINAYVVNSTGIAYIDFGGSGAMTVGEVLVGTGGFDHGWSQDINSETAPGFYCVRTLVDIKELNNTVNGLFEAVPGETTHVNNTLTWDGNIDGRTHWEQTVSDSGLSMTSQWVHVSDSIPTYEELTAGFEVMESNGLRRVYDPNEEFHWISITDDENCITLIFNETGIVLLPRIIKIPHTDSNGVVWEKSGIYFSKYNLTTAEGSDGGYVQSFTIPGYDFIVTEPDKKVIKDELIQVDATLTQEGKPADAKAVGDKIAAINIPNSLADLSQDTTHRTVTDTEKEAWNAKSNFSGSYNDLIDKPTIPSIEGLATETYVDNKVASIVDSSPETLDTLNELAKALGEDPNFATTVITEIGKKVDKVDGKELSTNDFADEYKEALDRLAGQYYSEGLAYVFKGNDEYEVSGIGTCEDTDIVIPPMYNDKHVTSIGNNAFHNCSNLTSIIIPDSITSIGSTAFWDCTNLTNITVPNSVTNIGSGAFQSCKALMSITLSDSITSIDQNMFYNCGSLKSITIPNGVTNIGNGAFGYCRNLTNITIPPSVTSIGEAAFNGCESLANITIPNGVTSIDEFVFGYCKSLMSVTIPDSVTSIGNYSFYFCSNLTSIMIPNKVTSIGSYAFQACSNLTSITIPKSVTSIGEQLFFGSYSLTIYCEAESQPESWTSNWNSTNRPVVWGVAPDFVSINEKLLNRATTEYVDNAVANVTVEVDTTLMQEGKAADAKAVGDRLTMLETALGAYITDIDSLVGGGIANEEEPSEPIPASISFTIAGTSYQAEEGMTWSEWVNSEYNTNGWTDDGEYVYNSFGVDVTFVSTDGTLSGRVTPNETIINGTDYHTRDAG